MRLENRPTGNRGEPSINKGAPEGLPIIPGVCQTVCQFKIYCVSSFQSDGDSRLTPSGPYVQSVKGFLASMDLGAHILST